MTSEWWRKAGTKVLEEKDHQVLKRTLTLFAIDKEQLARKAKNVSKEGANGSIHVFLADLKSCSKTQDLKRGKQVHAEAAKSGHNSNIHLASTLISMYARCRSMTDAQQVFDSITHPDVVSWTALILGYAHNGQSLTALELLRRMQSSGPAPNAFTLVAALKACTSLAVKGSGSCRDRGKEIHDLAVNNGFDSDIYVQSALIGMYAKCNSMIDARQVFDRMKHPDVVSWNVLVLGYADNGQGVTALELFTRMGNALTDSVTFVAALKACTSLVVKVGETGRLKWLAKGMALHNLVIEKGCCTNIIIQNTLIDMYTKCGSMLDARQVFDSMKHQNVVSWNALILGYAENGQGLMSLGLFTTMRSEGPAPNYVTFLAAFKACISLSLKGVCGWAKCRKLGKEIHDIAMENGCASDIIVQNTLIDMYGKCGSMEDAQQVFDGIKDCDVVSWTSLILGYAENGQGLKSLELFTTMKSEGPEPNFITVLAALKACIALAVKWVDGWERRGKEIHDYALEKGWDSNIQVQNALVDMYAKCGNMEEARHVFDKTKHPDVVSWTALILGYAENGQGLSALDLLARMISDGPAPNSVTLLAALKACTSLTVEGTIGWGECMRRGKQIHDLAVKIGCDSDIYFGSTLIDMYAKCGSMTDARQVFDSMKHVDVVSWNVLIMGYAANEEGLVALDLFTRMKTEGAVPNSVTFLAIIKACGLVGALEFGKTVHLEIESGNHLDIVLVNCLVDFYAKCGSLVEAQRLFSLHPETRNVVTWTALLAGFSNSGDHQSMFRVFKEMQDSGYQPVSVTFISILTCCSHAGLVEKGKECFDAMPSKYGIIPTIEHYTCMVDIFGRANKLHDAMALLKYMPCSPDDVIWTTILGACRIWKNVEIGRMAFHSLIQFNRWDAPAYVLMGQIYGSRGMLQEQELVLETLKARKTY